MIDFARVTVIAGGGGDGAGSFVHVKGKRRGKADGGDGGVGGSVYFVASANVNTLEAFRYAREYKAQSGQAGLSNKRKGAQGEDLVIKVPVGTQIKNSNLKFKISNLHDLTVDGQKVLVARGGQGGRGNCHLRDEFGRRPFKGEKGESGESLDLTLELKLIADVGLIGIPNAGKSTLISKLTSARPKIADYPFTTLEPNLGVMDALSLGHSLGRDQRSVGNFHDAQVNQNSEIAPSQAASPRSKIVIADIPGLIEGASSGKGLGDLFLRHIERTRVLVHVVDVSQDVDLWQIYQTIRNELKVYSKELAEKKEIIVLNKTDLVSPERLAEVRAEFAAHRKKVIAASAKDGEGIEDLVKALETV